MKLIDHNGDSVELEWCGPSGRTLVLTVEEQGDGAGTGPVVAAFALQDDETVALIAALRLAQRERHADMETERQRERARTRKAWQDGADHREREKAWDK